VPGTTGGIMLVVRPAATASATVRCPQFIFLTPEAEPGTSSAHYCFRFFVKFEWTVCDGSSSSSPWPGSLPK
jgi:hypothetical protein